MPEEKHTWRIAVQIDGIQRIYPNPNGDSSLTYFESEGTLKETLINVRKFMLNEREKRNKLECDLGKSS